MPYAQGSWTEGVLSKEKDPAHTPFSRVNAQNETSLLGILSSDPYRNGRVDLFLKIGDSRRKEH